MNLESKLDTLFDAACIAKQDSNRDTAINDLKKLETELNNHLRSKQGKKYKKVTLFNYQENQEDKPSFNDMIDNEIEAKYKNKKWSMLPMYLKWQYAEKYLKEKQLYTKDTINRVKMLINERDDKSFIYDHKEGILLNII